MSAPKFIRLKGNIINICHIEDVIVDDGRTKITYQNSNVIKFDGDVLDELWELIKFALRPKDESYPSDTTHLEERIKDAEGKITLIVDHIEADHVSRIEAAGYRKPASVEDVA